MADPKKVSVNGTSFWEILLQMLIAWLSSLEQELSKMQKAGCPACDCDHAANVLDALKIAERCCACLCCPPEPTPEPTPPTSPAKK